MRPARLAAALTLAVLAAPAISGCGSVAPQPGRLVVFAAASLRAAFTDVADTFHAQHPDIAVDLSFAGSADLLAQLTGGAHADVYASADTPSMDKAVAASVVNHSVPFATNTLTVVVAPGNPKDVRTLQDLRRVDVVVCAPQVPCGAARSRIEKTTGVYLSPVSEENSVRDVLNKVATGQADAGLVYVTDARAAGAAVSTVALPEAAGAVNTYRIAVTREAADPAAAQQFIDLVTGPTGRGVLDRAGFG